jgi:hypothetical protein
MDKRWYPVAVTAFAIGCGGDVDSGRPAATGGVSVGYYGPRTSDIVGIGGSATGGTSLLDASTPEIDTRACLTAIECTQCPYATAPTDSSECEDALGCCGGPVMNKETCNANQVAWNTYCSGLGLTAPICPCINPCSDTIPCSPTCSHGQCGFW